MKKVILLYAGLLFFYSFVMILFILAGSHGKIIFNDKETLRYLAVAGIFFIMAALLIATRIVGLKKWILTALIPFDLMTVLTLWYEIVLLQPETYTPLSIFVL